MLTYPTVDKLQQLRYAGMAKALAERLDAPEVDALSFAERPGLLVDCELTGRPLAPAPPTGCAMPGSSVEPASRHRLRHCRGPDVSRLLRELATVEAACIGRVIGWLTHASPPGGAADRATVSPAFAWHAPPIRASSRSSSTAGHRSA